MIEFELNGAPVASASEPDTPLLWVVRDELKLKGTKFGCGIAMCGACTVHIDGVATRACITPVSTVAGKSITTIEGLATDAGKALQKAWVDEQVPQCGYCQSGQIMQAAGFLEKTPNPTDQQITDAMNGNLCRCMAYTRIRKAIKTAASGGEVLVMAMRADKLQSTVTRRTFLASSASAGLVMGLGVVLPGCSKEEVASEIASGGNSASFAPSMWFEIDGNGGIMMNIPKAEMGQHVGTALARIIADELGASWDDVDFVHADSHEQWGKLIPGVSLGDVTGGSWSVFTSFTTISQAGAAGRTILRDAGAAMLGVDPADCTVEDSLVSANGKHVSFAEIVSKGDINRTLSEEELAALTPKPAAARRLVGKATNALDIPAKSRGEAMYGIDVELPGMVFGSPLMPPTRYGSSIKSIDDSAAKEIAGYQQTLQLTDPSGLLTGWAVVIADDFPSAMKAADAVVVEWEAGPTAGVSEEDLFAAGEKLVADKAAGTLFVDDGDVAAAQATAASSMSATYRTGTAMHYQLEPVNAVVEIVDGKCHVHAGNQYRAAMLPTLAGVLGLTPDDIVIHQYYLGGGFGRRLWGDYMIPSALAAQALGKPVKIVFRREEDARLDCVRSPSVQRLEASLDSERQSDSDRTCRSSRLADRNIVAGFPGCRWSTARVDSMASRSRAPITGTPCRIIACVLCSWNLRMRLSCPDTCGRWVRDGPVGQWSHSWMNWPSAPGRTRSSTGWPCWMRPARTPVTSTAPWVVPLDRRRF